MFLASSDIGNFASPSAGKTPNQQLILNMVRLGSNT